MKILRFFFLVSLVSTVMMSCQECISGEGDPIQETRTVEAFDKINSATSMDVSLVQTANLTAHKVMINAQENIIPSILTQVESKKLGLDIEGCVSNTKALNASVFFSEISRIEADGSGTISSANPIYAKRLHIDNNGSGDVEFEFNGDMLVINTDGSGDVKIKGSCKDLLVTSNGSGNVVLTHLQSDRVNVENNGSGNVDVHAVRKATINLNGSGNVSIKGNPQNLEQNNDGSGEILRIN